MPKRVQLSRHKGFRLPKDAVNVARPTRWGNPFKIGNPHPIHGQPMSRTEAIDLFRRWLFEGDRDAMGRHELKMGVACLRGFDLACWCKPGDACHADVWLELVNDPRTTPLETIKVGEECVIMGRRSRVTRLNGMFGFPSFEFEEVGSFGGGIYHEGMGRVYSLALLDLLDRKPLDGKEAR